MPNSAAERFVKNFKASIGPWKMPKETEALYITKLSTWRLGEDQWGRAISHIIADNIDGELWTVSKLEFYLTREKNSAAVVGCKAWMLWTERGQRKAVKVEKKDDVWVYAKCEYHDRDGNLVVLQKNPGKLAKPPKDSTDIHIVPDNEALPEPEDLPQSKAEILQIFAENWTGPKDKLAPMLKILAGQGDASTAGLENINPIIGRLVANAVTQEDLVTK